MASIESRQRVLMAIQHQVPDRVPRGELLVEEAFLDRFNTKRASLSYYEKMKYFAEEVGLDLVTVRIEDEEGEQSLKEIGRWATETNFFIMALVDGVFWNRKDPASFEEFITGISRGDKKIHDLIELKKEKTIGWVKKCLNQGAHGCIIGDDLAYHQGSFISPGNLKRWIFPKLLEIVEEIKSKHGIAFLHSCGNLTKIIDLILSVGFDGLHGLAPSAGNDPLAIKKKSHGRLTLMGIFEVHQEPQKILTAKAKFIRTLTTGGGFIFGSAEGLSANTPFESFRTLYSI